MTDDDAAPASREAMIGDGITWLSRWALRWIVIAAAAFLLGYAISRLWSILLPIVLAMILTTVLQPLALGLERRLRFPRALAAATVVLGLLGVLAALVALIAPSVGDQVGDIASSASDGLDKVQTWVQTSSLNITQDQVETAVSAVQDRLKSSASSIASGVLVGVSAVSSFLITALLTLVLTFFFLKDGRRFLPWLARVTGSRVGPHLAEVGSRAWATLGSFIRTQALVGMIDGVLIGLGLVVVGVPLAIPLAILTFFGGFVPIIGAVTVGALAVLVTLVTNGFTSAVIIFVVILAVQQLEGNILQPFLQGKSMNLHASVILLAVTLGSALYGIIGAFLAVPVVSVAAVVLRYLDERLVAAAGPAEGPATADPPAEDDGDADHPDGRDG